MSRILLINPNMGATPGINQGLASISAYLKSHGHSVDLLFLCERTGYGLDLERIANDIRSRAPDLVGISLVETQIKFARLLRPVIPSPVAWGGPYPTVCPEDGLFEGDRVCVGDGENYLEKLLEGLDPSSSDPVDVSALPMDDYDIFPMEEILKAKKGQLEMALSRGCPYECTYCINRRYHRIYGSRRIRVKGFGRVLGLIKSMTARYPINAIAFIDDNFTSISGIRDFLMRYKAEIGLCFTCNMNPLAINAESAAFLGDAGCDTIRLGIECGDEEYRFSMLHRRIGNDQIIKACSLLRNEGIKVSTYNMTGLPGETARDVARTLEMNCAIKPEWVKFSIFYPFVGTDLHDYCRDNGLIDKKAKESLTGYDIGSCLKFKSRHLEFLADIQLRLADYLNTRLGRRIYAMAGSGLARMAA